MRGWVHDPAMRSFGVKLLLLAGVMGSLAVGDFLTRPTPSARSEAAPVPHADVETPSTQSTPDVVSVDINHGSAEQFERLPGIGPVLAERVLRYRRNNGQFNSLADLQQVKGIGVKRFARLRPYLRLGRTNSSPEE